MILLRLFNWPLFSFIINAAPSDIIAAISQNSPVMWVRKACPALPAPSDCPLLIRSFCANPRKPGEHYNDHAHIQVFVK